VQTRPLGRTGLTVSELSLGTVSLGIDYGIPVPGDFGRPSDDESIALIRHAVRRGITLIDTAPAYGDAERILGRALPAGSGVVIATKLHPSAAHKADISAAVRASLESSCAALCRPMLDIVQIPNATREAIVDGALTRALLAARDAGTVRFLGATVYDEPAALAVINSGQFDVLQIAFDLLDQRKQREVVPRAVDSGVAVVVRSAFMKGALTRKAEHLPDDLRELRARATHARDVIAGGSWETLARVAVRFCLSDLRVSTVLTGPRTLAELEDALLAEAAGPLDVETLNIARTLALEDDALLNPSRWSSIP